MECAICSSQGPSFVCADIANDSSMWFFQTILMQRDRDDSIRQLYKTMDGVYAIVNEATLLKIQSRKLVIARMALQTIDCGYFICSYAKNKDFCTIVRRISKTISLTVCRDQSCEKLCVRCRCQNNGVSGQVQ
jgi:hypothetical protein